MAQTLPVGKSYSQLLESRYSDVSLELVRGSLSSCFIYEKYLSMKTMQVFYCFVFTE